MEDVLAACHFHAGFLSQTCYHADAAVVVFTHIFKHFCGSSLIVLLDAIFVEARQMVPLALESSAPMAACELLVAALISNLYTLFRFATRLECWVWVA